MKRKIATENFERFLACIQSPLMKLRHADVQDMVSYNTFTFEAILRNDKYIAKNSMFNLSEEYFSDIDKYGLLFMGQKPSFNNTGRIGWFTIKIEDGE